MAADPLTRSTLRGTLGSALLPLGGPPGLELAELVPG
jgi:hypothetical protein